MRGPGAKKVTKGENGIRACVSQGKVVTVVHIFPHSGVILDDTPFLIYLKHVENVGKIGGELSPAMWESPEHCTPVILETVDPFGLRQYSAALSRSALVIFEKGSEVHKSIGEDIFPQVMGEWGTTSSSEETPKGTFSIATVHGP